MKSNSRTPRGLSRLKHFLEQGVLSRLRARGRRRLRAGVNRYQFESLENRQVLATILDGGTELFVALSLGELVTVRSAGTTYELTTGNRFFNGGVANSADFSSFGSGTLTIQSTGLTRYNKLNFLDDAPGATVTFEDSGANAYSDSISVRLDLAQFSAISFNGNTSFTSGQSLAVSTSSHIAVRPGGTIQTVDGAIDLTAIGDVVVQGQVVSATGTINLRADAIGLSGGIVVTIPTAASEQAVLRKPDPSDDQFGTSVAFSADGNTVIVGAPMDDSGVVWDQGSAAVYVRSGDFWALQQELFLPTGSFGDQFGSSVALSADGNIAVVGAIRRDIGIAQATGSVTVFSRTGSTWNLVTELSRPGRALNLGESVAISGDGSTILVGAHNQGENVPSEAVIYVNSGGNWVEQAYLQAAGAFQGDAFGDSVALSYNGNTAVVGASGDDVGNKNQQGSATVFVRSGNVWSQQQQLLAPDGSGDDFFGTSVAISADGNTIVVGSPGDDLQPFPVPPNEGSATIFTRSGTTWSVQQKLLSTAPYAGALLGTSATLSADGNSLLLGGVGGAGTVSHFIRQGTQWIENAILTGSGVASGDGFGASVSFAGDGRNAIVGAPHQPGASLDQGAAHVFQLNSKNGQVASPGGQVNVSAFSVDWRGTLIASLAAFAPSTANMPISLGLEVQPFSLTEAELDRVYAATLSFGSATTGEIGITSPITRNAATNMSFTTAINYLGFNGVNTNGGSFSIQAGENVGFTGSIQTSGGNISIVADANRNGVGEFTVLDVLSQPCIIDAGTGSFTLRAAGYVNNSSLGSINASSVTLLTSETIKMIEVGGSSPNNFSISVHEFNQFKTPVLNIGSADSGPITLLSSLIRQTATKLTLTAGDGLDIEFLGPAMLDSRGGEIVLNVSGLGDIVPGDAPIELLADANKISISSGAGDVGEMGNPLTIMSTSLTTSGGSGDYYLANLSAVNIVSPGWGAGTGNLVISGDFVGGTIDPRSRLTILAGSWSVDSAQTVDGFTLVSGQLMGTGSLSTANTFRLTSGTVVANLGGSGNVMQLPVGSTSLLGNNTYTGNTTVVGGTLALRSGTALGNSAIVEVQAGAVLDTTTLAAGYRLNSDQTLAGSGTVRGAIAGVLGTHLSPGGNPGTLSTGTLSLDRSILDLNINGSAAGQYDQLNVAGFVGLFETQLNIVLGYQPQLGDVLTIINNDGTDPIASNFLDLQEGALLSVTTGNFIGDFKISYAGGDGNDVTLSTTSGLAISVLPTVISEEGGTAVGTARRFNVDTLEPLLVTLTSSDTTAAVVPSSVVIPAGATFITFPVTAVDDQLLDGFQNVTISGASTLGDAQYVMRVRDSEYLTLSVVPPVREGESVIATLTRSNVDISQSLTVSLGFSNSEASAPSFVTIPAGQASTTFSVSGLRDSKLDGTQTSQLFIFHSAYNQSVTQIEVLDAEFLSVSINRASISELGGSATGTVTRSNSLNLGSAVTIALTSSDTTEAAVPATVTIPAGQASATFAITAVDDNLLDGTQTVTISASNALYYGSGSSTLDVTDVELLSLSLDKSSIAEPNETATATVTRNNTDISGSVTVAISHNDSSEISAPDIVVIQAGQASATFPITAVADSLLDGTQTVTLIVAALGYVSAASSINVTDGEFLSLEITPASISELGGSTTATVRRSNTNIAQSLTVNLSSNDTTEATVPGSVVIPANAAFVTFSIAAVDDTLLDGSQSVTISAAATNYRSATAAIEVTDHELLGLSFGSPQISERGDTVVGTVMRGNTDISQAITVALSSSDLSEATVPATVTIAPNQTSVNFIIEAVDDDLLDGVQTVIITASSSGYVPASQALGVTDVEDLSITLSNSDISENGGRTTATVTRSNSDQDLPLVVSLTSDDISEATVPATVTIPQGQAAVTFDVSAVDDNLLDGTRRVSLSAAAAGYSSGLANIDVTDYESLSIAMGLDSISEAGGVTTATVRRNNTDISAAITVVLKSSDLTEATLLASLTIPSNQSEATFNIFGVDDNLLDGLQQVNIQALATGYVTASRQLDVTDFETLSLTFSQDSISEAGGTALATVSRSNSDLASPLTVSIQSSDTGEATVPATVIIAANQSSATFAIAGMDDSLLDGPQTVHIGVQAAGYVDGTRSIVVADAESILVTIDKTNMSETGGTATATVSRSNSDNSQALTVTLVSSDTTEAQIPTFVTIPSNASSATFVITAVDDLLLDGPQVVTITAFATGYTSGAGTITIDDAETLSISLAVSSLSENGGQTTATVTRSNVNVSQAVVVTLASSDTSEVTVPATVTIPAGQASTTFSVSAVDDQLLDGTQSVTISAVASGYLPGSRALNVTDHESLAVSFDKQTMRESGDTAIGTVSRSNTDTASPLTVQLQINDLSEASIPETVVIPAGQSSVTFAITAVDDALLDGSQVATVTAAASGYQSSSGSIEVADIENLLVDIALAEIAEKDGITQGTISRSNSDTAIPLIVHLTSSDLTEASVPATVTIAAGVASATFQITAVDDDLLDGPMPVTISARAAGYEGDDAALTVTDVELLTLTLQTSSINEAGGTVMGTVRRGNSNLDASIVVNLVASNASQVNLPAAVNIPAGQAAVDFMITAIDDALLDGTQVVDIMASATGYSASTTTLRVTDAETLTLQMDSSSIDEAGGRAQATVTRSNTDIAASLVVSIVNDRPGEVSAPSSVTIPAGQASASFEVLAIDDHLFDGPKSVTLSAQAAGYADGSDSVTVNDIVLLDLVLNVSQLREDGSAIRARISRSNTDIDQSLTVQLQSSDSSEASVPATVTIPSSAAFVEFDITPADDALLDGVQSVTISANSPGYRSASRSITVEDAEVLTLSLDRSETSELGGSAQATVQRSNTDTTLPLTVSIANSDSSEATAPTVVIIPAGQRSATFAIVAVDDTLLDGLQVVQFEASAVGYLAASGAKASLNVTDAENLSITIEIAAMSENGGQATAIVSRSNTDTSLPLQVDIVSNDTTEANAPAQIMIPAGQSFVTFAIAAVDDNLLDGTQTVQINVQAAGYAGSTSSLQVTDQESIIVSVATTTISEKGGSATVVVRRSNSDASVPLTITLTSSDTSELTVPGNVTIPAGQAEVSFNAVAVDERTIDGSAAVTVEAKAAGYTSGSVSIVVEDNDPEFPWQNPRNPLDVNDNGVVTPLDALLVINALNARVELPPDLPVPFDPVQYLDVDANGLVTPIDALLVINHLNLQVGGEGELVAEAVDDVGQAVDWEFLQAKRKR